MFRDFWNPSFSGFSGRPTATSPFLKFYGSKQMNGNKRIVVLGRDSSDIDQLTRILEGAGYIVSSTTNDSVAVDMVGSSSYDALLIARDVAEADRRYVSTQSRNRDVGLLVLTVNSPRSILTQLAQNLR